MFYLYYGYHDNFPQPAMSGISSDKSWTIYGLECLKVPIQYWTGNPRFVYFDKCLVFFIVIQPIVVQIIAGRFTYMSVEE